MADIPLFDGDVTTSNFGIGVTVGAESADAGVSMATDAVDDVEEATAAAMLTQLAYKDTIFKDYNECGLIF